MKKELIITKEDIKLLKEMKENCLKSSVYDDEKRLLKANAITKFLNLLDTNKKQKEVIDKAINFIKNGDLLYLANKNSIVYRNNIEIRAVADRLNDLLQILEDKEVSE